MRRIDLSVNGKKVVYHSETNIVTFYSSNGVLIEAEPPRDWALTRIFQFMESLAASDKTLT